MSSPLHLKRSSFLDLNQTFVEDDDDNDFPPEQLNQSSDHPPQRALTSFPPPSHDLGERVCSSGTDELPQRTNHRDRFSRSHSFERTSAPKVSEEERKEVSAQTRKDGRRSSSPTPSPRRKVHLSPISQDSLTSPARRSPSRESSERRRRRSSPHKPERRHSPLRDSFSRGGTEYNHVRLHRDYHKRAHRGLSPSSVSPQRRTHRSKRSYSRSPPQRGWRYSSRARYSPEGRYFPRRRSPPGYRPRKQPWAPPPNRNTGLGKPGRDIFIAGFSFDTTERDLERKFSRYGRVKDVRIVRDKRSGNSRGFGFLSLGRDEEADAAIRALDKTEWNGRIVLVEKVKSPN